MPRRGSAQSSTDEPPRGLPSAALVICTPLSAVRTTLRPMAIRIVRTLSTLRRTAARWRASGERIALVPTMGALHSGHLALVRSARRRAQRVVVSIFVNPAQFAPNEDLASYPRSFEADIRVLGDIAADLVWAPAAAVMYPPGFVTRIVPEGPATAGLEDRFRPHFFSGVATVVAKLLIQCTPDFAMFGEKDYQQLKVVTRLAKDLDLPVKIVAVATVRERDGLALSSRNSYLSASERAGFVLDYLEARHADTLEPISSLKDGPIRLLVAARIGKTRLIDNIAA